MIRSAQYMGQRRRVVRYTDTQWSDPEFRRVALSEARAEATSTKGEIIIKVTTGRHLTKVASVRYVDGGARVWHARR